MSLLDGIVDLTLGRALVGTLFGFGLVLGAVGDEGALDLVRVEETGFLAVGLVQVVLVGIGASTQEICSEETGFNQRTIAYHNDDVYNNKQHRGRRRTVECHIGSFSGDNLIIQTKDLIVLE